MKKVHTLSLVFVFAMCLSPLAKTYSQTTVSADALKNILIDDWVRAKAYTQDYMKAMPTGKYSFKPADSVRTFAQQFLHIAQSFSFFTAIAMGEKPDFSSARPIENIASAQSADSVMYFVNSGYDAVINKLKGLSTADLMKNETFTMDKPYTSTRLAWFMKAFEHQTHHRGQTTIYLRMAGVKPPDERLF